MSFAFRTSAAAVAVLATTALGAAVVTDSGRAQNAGTTYTITYGKSRGAMTDVAPKGIARGRASLGDQFFNSAAIRRNDGARGRLVAIFTVADNRVSLVESKGLITGVYRFADGDLFLEAAVTFDDADTDHGAIIGGTGAYAGAHGTIESSKTSDVLHLLP